MPAVFLAIEHEAAVTQREFAILLAGCDGVRQHTAHGKFALVGDNLLTQVHHSTALGDDVSPTLGILLDGTSSRLGLYQCLKMLLGITAWKIEQCHIVKARHVSLRVKERHILQPVDILLINKGERLLGR